MSSRRPWDAQRRDAVIVDPALLDETKQYVANLAAWLAAPEKPSFAEHTYANIGEL
jgi:hypothetical protein